MHRLIPAIAFAVLLSGVAGAETRSVVMLRSSTTGQVIAMNAFSASPTQAVIIDPSMPITAAPQVIPFQRQMMYSYPQSYQMRGGALYQRNCSSGRCRWVRVR